MPTFSRPYRSPFLNKQSEDYKNSIVWEYVRMLGEFLSFMDGDIDLANVSEKVLLAYFTQIRKNVDSMDEFNLVHPPTKTGSARSKSARADFLHKLKKILNAPRLKTLVKKGEKEKPKPLEPNAKNFGKHANSLIYGPKKGYLKSKNNSPYFR